MSTDEKKEKETINVLSSNVFNKEKAQKTEWRFLTNEQRVAHIEKYFELEFNNENTIKKIDHHTKTILIDLAKKGKLKIKKQITYDTINERISCIHALLPEQHTDNYVYKPEVLNKKEKSKKVARTLLFRKK